MRVTYGRELKLQKLLHDKGIECYVPVTTKGNRKVSAIANLIFIFTTKEIIQTTKIEMESIIPVRYFMDRTIGKPMTVPKKEMEDFIRLTSNNEDGFFYLENPGIVFSKGQKVRISYGPLCGINGYVLRIKRDRKVVVTINGLISAAITADLKPEWLKPA